MMQNYLQGKTETIKDILGRVIGNKKKNKEAMEGRGLQSIEAYRENMDQLNQAQSLYNSFQDVGAISEERATNLVNQAQDYLSRYEKITLDNTANINRQLQEAGNNAAAAARSVTSRGGLPSEAGILTTKSIADETAMKKAEQNTLTQQQLQAAAAQFIDQAAKINDANTTNQLNARNLAKQYGETTSGSYSGNQYSGGNSAGSQSGGIRQGEGDGASQTSSGEFNQSMPNVNDTKIDNARPVRTKRIGKDIGEIRNATGSNRENMSEEAKRSSSSPQLQRGDINDIAAVLKTVSENAEQSLTREEATRRVIARLPYLKYKVGVSNVVGELLNK